MSREQEVLIQLLNCLVYDKKFESTLKEKINWEGVIKEAKEHRVLGMIYPVIDTQQSPLEMTEEIKELWKRETFKTAIRQIQHINQVTYILSCFKAVGIPVIVLKGMVVRAFYPRPELRTMCDADLLVKKQDVEAINQILIKEGYIAQEKSVVHIQYIHPKGNVIEIHWTIRDERIFNEVEDLEEHLWQEAVPVCIGDIEVFSLGLEDLMLHVCVHMATHLCVGGFGIRQVIDLAMMVKQKGEALDWKRFVIKAQAWNIGQFIVTLFDLLNRLFLMDVPTSINALGQVNKKATQQLIEDIMSAGVYGKRNQVQVISNELAKDLEGEREGKQSSVLMSYIRYIFPSANKMEAKYGYIKRYKCLLPIAWIHHLWNGMMHKEYRGKNKLSFLLKSLRLSYKRNRLLRQLKL